MRVTLHVKEESLGLLTKYEPPFGFEVAKVFESVIFISSYNKTLSDEGVDDQIMLILEGDYLFGRSQEVALRVSPDRCAALHYGYSYKPRLVLGKAIGATKEEIKRYNNDMWLELLGKVVYFWGRLHVTQGC